MNAVPTVTTPEPPQPLDKSAERIRDMFGQIAGRYDLLNRLLSGGVDVYWRKQTVRHGPPDESSDPILDVCCGTGDLTLAYWQKSGGAVPVIGTDFTHPMLTRAGEKRDRRNSAPVEHRPLFVEADTQRLPFASDVFQLVCVAFGLRNVTDTRAGLREMIRVCKPGGRVVVLEFSTPTNRLFRSIYLGYFRHVLPRIGQLIGANRHSAYNYLPQSVSQFPSGPELAALMDGCGLSGTTHRPLTMGIATLYIGQKPGL